MNRLFFGFVFLATACGSGTEPINALNSSSQSVPQMQLPFTTIGTFTQGAGAFNSSSTATDGFTLIAVPPGSPVLAPVNGTVTNVDLTVDSGLTAVTITYNQIYSTRIRKMFSQTVRIGDQVTSGQAIGATSSTSFTILFEIFVGGTAVCPLSFLSSSVRQTFQTYSFSPCTN